MKRAISKKQPTLEMFPLQGRGAVSNPAGRFEPTRFEIEGEFLNTEGVPSAVRTEYHVDTSKSILNKNDSPDVGFDISMNPYKGCEHGCVYCFARPTHEYLNLSAGLDFETKIFFKPDAPKLLQKAFEKKGYAPKAIVLGSNTDIYQPLERKTQLTRKILEVFLEYKHPVSLITKSALILRDGDILQELARHQLVSVAVSITTLDAGLASIMEPRAAIPARRLENIRVLSAMGIPCYVLSSPMIPGLNDVEMDDILECASQAGAKWAAYILVRLPHQNKKIFFDWLEMHFPDRKKKIMNLLRQTHEGELYQSEFGTRMTGTGPYAQLLKDRFHLVCKRLGLNQSSPTLRTDLFQPKSAVQLPLLQH